MPHALCFALAAALGLTSFACKDKPAEKAGAPLPSATATATSLGTPPRPAPSGLTANAPDPSHGIGGRAGMFFAAIRNSDLKLGDDQKAKIDAIGKAARMAAGDAGAAADAAEAVTAELIAEAKAGKIEPAKIEPRYAAVERAAAAAHAAEGETLNALHAALDGAQRKAVVVSLRAMQLARDAQLAKRVAAAKDAGAPDGGGGKDAGGKDGGGSDRGGGGNGGNGNGGNGGGRRSLAARLTRDLDLDAEQQKKVDAMVAADDAAGGGRPDPAETRKRLEALFTAFEKDTFDAAQAEPFLAKNARRPLEHRTKLAAQLVPLLKPEQRARFADKLERTAGQGGGHGSSDDD